jgi:phosphoglycerate dehydrogenase-like enzyme
MTTRRFVVAISPDHMDPTYALERAGLGHDVELRPWKARTQEDLAREIADVDAVLTWRFRVEAPVIEALERCRVIVRMGVGFDVVDAAAAARRDISVCNIPDYCTNEVADHTLGLLLALTRHIPAYSEGLRAGNEAWTWDAAGPVHRITGRTLGIVGLGRIGTAVALRARAFGMRVVFTDPYARDGMDRALGLERLTLDELLSQADYVSLHTPLTDETRGLAGAGFFAKAKPGMVLVNTSRGPVVDIGALEEAMRSGRVAMAGLDVLPNEPPVPEPGLLRAWRADEEWVRGRLVVSPHAAFFSEEADHDMRVKAALTVREVLDGLPARNRVN